MYKAGFFKSTQPTKEPNHHIPTKENVAAIRAKNIVYQSRGFRHCWNGNRGVRGIPSVVMMEVVLYPIIHIGRR